MDRRDFIKNGSILLAATQVMPLKSLLYTTDYVSKRPPVGERKFTSAEVERVIQEIKPTIADKEIAWMFENCYPNTLDTTVDYSVINGKPDTFVITGDIDAMWLRDSSAQVWPYMPHIAKDEKLKQLVQGLIRRQTKCILLDPYANAFYKDSTRISEWKSDDTVMKPGVHEHKWEIDSLCYPIRLASKYYAVTKDASLFDADWDKAMRLVVKTFKTEQRKDGTTPYYFRRKTTAMTDAPPLGTGYPVKPNGLICSMFRPSDDATIFPFLIPSNIFASKVLQHLSWLYSNVLHDAAFATECLDLSVEIDKAIHDYAITEHLDFGKIYAYETDGFGNHLYMDDANVPSLIALTYIDAHNSTDTLYQNTRRFVLSDSNPFYFKGKAAEGQGSPHTGKVNIWPMGIILRAITSVDDAEIIHCLTMLKNTHADTGFIHESFNKDNAADYSRSWFAWANTLFGELIVKLHTERKHILDMQF